MWYVMSVGLVPDRLDIANGIGALLIITVLVFNLVLTFTGKYLYRKMTGVM
jgi:phosphate transport system permease protein